MLWPYSVNENHNNIIISEFQELRMSSTLKSMVTVTLAIYRYEELHGVPSSTSPQWETQCIHVVHLRLSTAIVPLVGFMVGFTVVVGSPSSATVVLLPGALLCQIHLILKLHNTRTGKYI